MFYAEEYQTRHRESLQTKDEAKARRLIAAVEAEARRRGLPGVRLGVRVVLTENQRLFGALGYVETSREPHPGFDYPTSINMRKALE